MRLALFLLLLPIVVAQAELLMVYSVQRHGARNVLSKSDKLKESDAAGGPTLLPEGQRQAWKAGEAYRARYFSGCLQAGGAAACLATAAADNKGPEYGVVGSPDGEFNNFNTLVRSSSLDRTIMTARSFLDAVFPPINQPTPERYLPDGQQVVPVYSLPEDGGALIRGYTACPAYDRRLEAWYNSTEFAAKEEDSAALRATISATAPGLDTSLKNWWNVYDGFNVYRTYGVGTPMPALSNATFGAVQELAYWLETRKMMSSLTGNLLSGLLLGDLLRYLEGAEAAAASNDIELLYYRMLHLSGHYNTQLGVLGALALDQYPAAANIPWLRQKIPSLAAILVFELHGDAARRPQELAVRLVMQDGPKANYSSIPLPCTKQGDSAEALAGPGACTLEAFRALVAPLALNSTQEWCTACDNASQTKAMSICQLQAAEQQLRAVQTNASGASTSSTTASSGTGASTSSSSGLSAGAVAGIAVGCVAATLAACGAGFFLYHRRMQVRMDQAVVAAAYQTQLPAP